MTVKTITFSYRKLGRLTGLFYFQIIAAGLVGSLYFRGFIIDMNDPLVTFQNIISNEFHYRLGFLSDLTMVIADVMVSVLFYFLLKNVNHAIALFAMVFRLIQSAILGSNLINLFKPLLLLKNKTVAEEVTAEQIMRSLEQFDHGYLISGVFFAINCMLMGYLIYHSNMIPKWIGIMIGLASIGYLANCLANFISPGFIQASEMIMFFTAVVAEVSLCFYLLIKGVKQDASLAVE